MSKRISELIQRTPDGTEFLEVIIPPFTTGTNRKVLLSDVLALVSGVAKNYSVAASNETTPLTVGTSKVTFRMPFAITITQVRASLNVAQSSGSIFTVDINKNGTTILSTKLTIDNTEKTSVTAATPAVISVPSTADDSEMSIDVDQIGNGTAVGLKITIIGT